MQVQIGRPFSLTTLVSCAFCALFLQPNGKLLAADEISATTSQRIHPVLIGKDHNPLLKISITIEGANVSVTSFTISLKGTTDKDDLESLELYSAGEGGGFSADKPFGDSLLPSDKLVFRGRQLLKAGTHVFWLSCKLKEQANLLHQVNATCDHIETSGGESIPKNTSPDCGKRIGLALRKHNDEDVHTYRIPALATTPKGTLLCVYDMRRRMSRDLQEDIDIGLSRSTDGGQTWAPAQVIMDMGEYGELPQEQNGCSDPGIIVDPATGEIFCFAVWMWGKPGKHQWRGDGSEPGFEIGKSAQFMMVRSKDDGLTWSKPQNLTRKLKKAEWWLFAPAPQQGIALRDGTLVMPTQGRDAKGVPFSNIMHSVDHGETWVVSKPASIGNSECQAVRLDDDSIMLNMRTQSPTKFRTIYVTSDLGNSWRAHESNRKGLIEPNCNGSLYRFDYIEDGTAKHILLFANPHTQKGRDHHTIQVSFDEGVTWPEKFRLLLDEGLGRGYPSITRVDDEHVGIVYEGSQADLVFEKLSLRELVDR